MSKTVSGPQFSLIVDRTQPAAMRNRGKVDKDGNYSILG